MELESARSAGRQKLGQRLVARGLVSESDVERMLKRQKTLPPEAKVRRLGSLLVEAGLVSARQVAEVLGEQHGIPAASGTHGRLEPAVRALFPKAVLQSFQAVPLCIVGKAVAVAMADPYDHEQVTFLQSLTSYAVRPMQAPQIQVQQLLAMIKDTEGPPAPAFIPQTSPQRPREPTSRPGLTVHPIALSRTPTGLPAIPSGAGPAPASSTSGRGNSAHSPRRDAPPAPPPPVHRSSRSWDGDHTIRLVAVLLVVAVAVSAGLLWKFQQDASAPVKLEPAVVKAPAPPPRPAATPTPAPRPASAQAAAEPSDQPEPVEPEGPPPKDDQ